MCVSGGGGGGWERSPGGLLDSAAVGAPGERAWARLPPRRWSPRPTIRPEPRRGGGSPGLHYPAAGEASGRAPEETGRGLLPLALSRIPTSPRPRDAPDLRPLRMAGAAHERRPSTAEALPVQVPRAAHRGTRGPAVPAQNLRTKTFTHLPSPTPSDGGPRPPRPELVDPTTPTGRRGAPGAAEHPGVRPPCSAPCLPQPLPFIKRALLFFQRRCPFSERCPRRVTQAAESWHGDAAPPLPAPTGRPEGTGLPELR